MSVKLIAPDVLENPNYEKPYIYDFKGLMSLPNQSDWWHIVYIPHIYNGPESGGYGYQIATKLAQDAKMFIRGAYGGIWGNWKQVAAAEPPQEFTLSLIESTAGWIRYSLDQTGFVHMQLYFTSTDGLDTHTLLAILPVGYRPLHAVVCPIVCRKSNGAHSGFLDIRADGSVYADTYGDGGKATYGGASFSFRAVVG